MQLTVAHEHVYTIRAVYHDAVSRETMRTRSPMTFEQKCQTGATLSSSRTLSWSYLRPHPVISGQQTISEGVRNI